MPFNPTVGDLQSNAESILELALLEAERESDLIVFPELSLCGYPPRDLLLQEGFVDAAMRVATTLAARLPSATVLFGTPWFDEDAEGHATLRNSILVVEKGVITRRYDKRLLPTYDVFDEDRYFTPGAETCVIECAGVRVGLSICEDLWRGEDARISPRYRRHVDPLAALVEAGAEFVVNPSASPFSAAKRTRQDQILAEQAARLGVPLAMVNQHGANDELVFDGRAVALEAADGGSGSVVGENVGFEGDPLRFALEGGRVIASTADSSREAMSDSAMLFSAIRLGVRDYCLKTGFDRGVVVGLSGGIDSALVACVAVAALGRDRVLGVSMPSRYSSEGSRHDAESLAERLGIAFQTIPIESAHASVEGLLQPAFRDLDAPEEFGVAEENVQARLRGVVLMGFSNKLGRLLLTTGNKSEIAVGYCTLYGDMNGGLAVLADLTKAQVYQLARWVNEHSESCGAMEPPVPPETLEKPPSAELRPNQTDQDSLPHYDIVDEVVARYVEGRQSASRIIQETGFEASDVERLVRLIRVNEYKRRQAAPGLKVSDVAFGTGWRMPLAMRLDDRA